MNKSQQNYRDDSFSQISAAYKGGKTPQPHSSLADAKTNASSLASIVPQIKTLLPQQVIATTVQSCLLQIMKNQNDTVLQKSMLAMLNQWINTHEIVSTSMRRRGSMGEISNISLPSTLSTMSEPKRAPSVLLKPLKDFAPKTNLFEIKNFNYAKEKQDEIARRNKKAYSETSSQKEMNRKLKMKMGMQMARNLSKLLGKMGKKKEEEQVDQEKLILKNNRKEFEAELMVRAIEEGKDQDKETKKRIRKIARKVTRKMSMLIIPPDMPLGEISEESPKPIMTPNKIAQEMFMEKQRAIDVLFGDPSIGPPLRRCQLYKGNEMEMLLEDANEESSSFSGTISSNSVSDKSEENSEVGELETSPTIDVSQKTGLGLKRLSNPSSTLRARRKNSILDMRDTGRLDTIHEARDEQGSTITTVLRGHVSDAHFKNTLGPAQSTMHRLQETIKDSVSEESQDPIGQETFTRTEDGQTTKSEPKPIPMRPPPNPAKIIDMTFDAPFERKWKTILPYKGREEVERMEDIDVKYQYQYDRRPIDQELFEAFQDQGDEMRKYPTIEELRDDAVFWRMEQGQALVAKDLIKKLQPFKPHDLFKMDPQGYNLSIQYEQERKGVEAKKNQKEKKKKRQEELVNANNEQGEILQELERNKKIANNVASGKFGSIDAAQQTQIPKGAKGSKAMTQALEQLVSDTKNSDPIFSRGAELEITTMQDVEMLKAHLATMKIHLPTETLTKAIVMPKDMETNPENYPKIKDMLLINPFKGVEKVQKKGRKKEGKDGKNKRMMKAGAGVGKQAPELEATGGGKLLLTENQSYKVAEFGNFPVLSNGKPRGGTYRLFLPADADWTVREKEDPADAKKNNDDLQA